MARPRAAGTKFREQLRASLERAVAQLRTEIGSESLYAFALYTNGEDAFSYVSASANTEEALTRAAAKYAETDAEYAGEAGRALLRWSAPDWGWHDFSAEVGALELPAGESTARDRRVYADFTAALQALDAAGVFGTGERRPMLAIVCGDMSDEFLLRSLEALNSRAAVAKYRQEQTAEGYLEELARLPPSRRVEVAVDLYRELALGLQTPSAADARRRHVTQYVLEPVIARLGRVAAPRLIDLVEANGFGATFDEPGSALENKLATSAAFLAGDAGLSDADVARVQRLLARRIEVDGEVKGPTSPLAAILARVLRAARPQRFPDAMQNATTNRLDNPDAYRARPWWRFW